MTTGLTPPCSDPCTGDRYLNETSPRLIIHSLNLKIEYLSLQSHASHSIGKASFARERFKSAICEYPSFKDCSKL